MLSMLMRHLALATLLSPALASGAAAQLSLSVDGSIDIAALGFDAVGGLTFDARNNAIWVCDSGATTNDVVQLDAATGQVLSSFDASAVPGLDFGPDALVSDPATGDLTLWSVFQRDAAGIVTPTGQPVTTFASSQGITGATYDGAGQLFGCSDTFGGGVGALHQLDPGTGALLSTVPIVGYMDRVSALTFDPQTGNLFAYADETEELLELDAATGAILTRTNMWPYLLDFSFPTGMAFDSTGELLYIARGAFLGGPDTVLVLRRSPVGTIEINCDPANPHSGFLPVRLDDSYFTVGALHLEATLGLADQFGYFLVSGALVDPGTPVSDGLLCLGAPFGRYAPSAGPLLNSIGQFDFNGVFQNLAGTSFDGRGFDVPSTLPSPPGGSILPGSTWHFQLWYRDGQVSNLSNVASVTFP